MIRDDAIAIWKAGVAAVHGRTLVEQALRLDGNQLLINNTAFDLDQFDRIMVVGGGKFSHFMAEGIEAVLGNELAQSKQLSGLVTVPDGSNEQVQLNFIEAAECRPAGINLPTQRVLEATERMVELLVTSDERTLVLALISGGGSALIERSTLPLEDIIAATNWLSHNGANIIELNSVRIAMSDVKGGGLALAMPAGTLVGLIVSDVPGDDLRFVSSGPTVGSGYGSFTQARDVLDRFDVANKNDFPKSVVRHMYSKVDGPVNQHAVLSTVQCLLQQRPQNPFCFLSAGTDGEDGNTTVAGAYISHLEMDNLAGQASEIKESLHQFNSHPILKANNLTFESGPTATNVADLRVILRNN